jgi:hypothetical protein
MGPYADAVITIGMPAEVIGPLHMPLAVLSATTGDWDAFERHRAATVRWFADAGGTAWVAVAQYYFAAALLRAGSAGAADEARLLLEGAAATSRELGLSRVEALVAELLPPP